jgi:hypothetical protein
LHRAAQLGPEGVGLPLFSPENFQQIARCLQLFHDAAELAEVAMAAEKPEDIMAFLKEHWIDKLHKLEPGNMLIAPGGWEGLLNRGSVFKELDKKSSL